MGSKSRTKELARQSAARIFPKINLKQIAGDAIFLSGARRLPNFAASVGMGRYQNALDQFIAGVAKSIVTGGGKSLSRVGIASAASNVVEDIVPLVSGLLGRPVSLPGGPVAPGPARRVSN